MINQKHLQTFMKLVETGHFTKTAEQLFMTQPGVTQHIKKLEQHFGGLLLQRYGKQFELTLAGEKLYQTGLSMQALETQLAQTILQDAPTQGACTFACSGAMASFLYPHFIQRQIQHPQLTVSIEAAPNNNILRDLLNNKVDLGLVSIATTHEKLQQTFVGSEALQLVLPAQATWDAQSGFAELNALGFINHPDGLHFIEKVCSANFQSSYTGTDHLQIKGYVNQLQQILLPVAQGVGFTILPERAVLAFSQPSLLRIVPLAHRVEEPVYLTQKRYRSLPQRYPWFEQKIKQLLS